MANHVQARKLIQAARKLLAEDTLVVLTDEDYEALPEEQKATWKGYKIKMAYDVVTEESAQDGEAAESGWHLEEEDSPEFMSLKEACKDSDVRNHTWVEWSSMPKPDASSWLISESEQDMQSGDYTQYQLWFVRADKKPLSAAELEYITDTLNV